jgi:hypothetical protein
MPLPTIAKKTVTTYSLHLSINAELLSLRLSAPPSYPLRLAKPPSGGADSLSPTRCQVF